MRPPRPDSRWGFVNTRMPPYLTAAWHHYLIHRDGDACFYCGDRIPDGEGTLEHLIPAMPALEGCYLTVHWNLARVHRDCNRLAGSNRLARKLELRDYLRGAGGHHALHNVRARFKRADPMARTGARRQRRLTAKHKRRVVRAWLDNPTLTTIGELVPELVGWKP